MEKSNKEKLSSSGIRKVYGDQFVKSGIGILTFVIAILPFVLWFLLSALCYPHELNRTHDLLPTLHYSNTPLLRSFSSLL